MTFKELKRAAKSVVDGDLRVAVTGDCATQILSIAIKGAFAVRGVNVSLFEADYGQTFRQVMTAESDLHKFKPAFTVVFESVERWWMTNESVAERIARVQAYAEHCPGRLVYVNAGVLDDGVFGSYAATEEAFAVRVRRFNSELDGLCQKQKNLDIVDLNTLLAIVGRSAGFEPSLYMTSDMPLSVETQAALAERIASVVTARLGRAHKCVVLDLDNTLWGGVIGEDGIEGIALGDHGVGKAHVLFQRMLKRLKERGVILAVCSKNDEPIAREPFEKHPNMVLTLDDIACFVANWETKADNIAHIQKVLNIGFDSLVFLDDNPMEREVVRLAHPSVCVPELPTDVAEWIPFLASGNYFETVSYSSEDAGRTKTYQEESRRRAWEATFKNEAEFLNGLEMRAEVGKLDAFSIPRVAQLTQRSNQFNLRTQRYSESDLEGFASRSDVVPFVFKLADKFGDYGIVSVIIGIVQGKDLFLDTWLMSCRVLKRGLEDFALNAVVKRAMALGLSNVVGEYLPTRKNGLVANMYSDMGFKEDSGRYRLSVADYQIKESAIHEENA